MGLGGKLARGFFSGATAAIPGAVDSLNQARNRNQQQSQFLASQAQQKSQFETTEERLSTEAENRLTAQNEANRIAQDELALRQQTADRQRLDGVLGRIQAMTSKDEVDAFQMPTFVNPEDQGRVASFVQQALGRIANDETVRLRDIEDAYQKAEREAGLEARFARQASIRDRMDQIVASIQNHDPGKAAEVLDIIDDGEGTPASDYAQVLRWADANGLSGFVLPPMPTREEIISDTDRILAENPGMAYLEAKTLARNLSMPQLIEGRRNQMSDDIVSSMPPFMNQEQASIWINDHPQWGKLPPDIKSQASQKYLTGATASTGAAPADTGPGFGAGLAGALGLDPDVSGSALGRRGGSPYTAKDFVELGKNPVLQTMGLGFLP